MKHRSLPLILFAVLALGFAGCNKGHSARESRPPRTVFIPSEMSFEEAAETAVPGDTLLFVALPVAVSRTVEFSADKTPVVLRGSKGRTLISANGDFPPVLFHRPKAGTRLESLSFHSSQTALRVEGPGELAIDDCWFTGSRTQIQGLGAGLRLDVTGCLLRNPELLSIDMGGGTELIAFQNTLDGAGDSGIRLQSGAVASVRNCIITYFGAHGIICSTNAGLQENSGCNDLYPAGTAGYEGCAPPADDFSEDPLFCDRAHGVYTLADASPCAEDNSGGCGRIGAFPPGCVPSPSATEAGFPLPGSR